MFNTMWLYNCMASDTDEILIKETTGICRRQMLQCALGRLNLTLLCITPGLSFITSFFLSLSSGQILQPAPPQTFPRWSSLLHVWLSASNYYLLYLHVFCSHYNVISIRGSPVARATGVVNARHSL